MQNTLICGNYSFNHINVIECKAYLDYIIEIMNPLNHSCFAVEVSVELPVCR